MAVARLGAAMVVAVVWAANVAWAEPHAAPVGSPFGGTVTVHIAHVGRIDADLAPSGSGGLRQVPCFGDSESACFVARPAARTSNASRRSVRA
jgi:hypothetical protein